MLFDREITFECQFLSDLTQRFTDETTFTEACEGNGS